MAAVLLLLVAVTGVLLQVEQLQDQPQKEAREHAMPRVTVRDAPPDLSRAWQIVARMSPESGVKAVDIDLLGDAPSAVFHLGTDRMVRIDIASNRVLGDEPDEPESFLLRLHTGEVFGDGGVVLGLLWGLALVALTVTGAVMYIQMLGRRRRAGHRGLFWSVVLVLMVGTAPRSVNAGSPFLTDDPGFIASGWEVKLAAAHDKSASGITLLAPIVDLNYTLTEHFKLNLTLAGRQLNPESGRSASGLADTDVKFKWRFHDETPEGVAMSIAPNVTIPTASTRNSLGDGVWRLRLPIQLGKTWGRWYGFAEGGYQFAFSPESSNAVIYGAGTQLTLNKQWTIGAELNGALATRERSNWGLLANVGTAYQASHSLQIQGSIGRTLRDTDRGGSELFLQFFLQWQYL